MASTDCGSGGGGGEEPAASIDSIQEDPTSNASKKIPSLSGDSKRMSLFRSVKLRRQSSVASTSTKRSSFSFNTDRVVAASLRQVQQQNNGRTQEQPLRSSFHAGPTKRNSVSIVSAQSRRKSENEIRKSSSGTKLASFLDAAAGAPRRRSSAQQKRKSSRKSSWTDGRGGFLPSSLLGSSTEEPRRRSSAQQKRKSSRKSWIDGRGGFLPMSLLGGFATEEEPCINGEEGEGIVRSTFTCPEVFSNSDASLIEEVMDPVQGVEKVLIDILNKNITVIHNASIVTAQDIEELLNKNGFAASTSHDGAAESQAPVSTVGRSEFYVEKICCAKEVPIVDSIVSEIPGVSRVTINVTTKTVYVDHDNQVISASNIADTLSSARFGAIVRHDSAEDIHTEMMAFVRSTLRVDCSDLSPSEMEKLREFFWFL